MLKIIGQLIIDLIADNQQVALFDNADNHLSFGFAVGSSRRIARIIDHERLDAFAAGRINLFRRLFKPVGHVRL